MEKLKKVMVLSQRIKWLLVCVWGGRGYYIKVVVTNLEFHKDLVRYPLRNVKVHVDLDKQKCCLMENSSKVNSC